MSIWYEKPRNTIKCYNTNLKKSMLYKKTFLPSSTVYSTTKLKYWK